MSRKAFFFNEVLGGGLVQQIHSSSSCYFLLEVLLVLVSGFVRTEVIDYHVIDFKSYV